MADLDTAIYTTVYKHNGGETKEERREKSRNKVDM
jgi:hypothetical protein